MRKIFFTALLIFYTISNVVGQASGNWQNRSFEADGVYGAGINKARAAAVGMKPSKKPVIVALIGYGIDVKHEAIKDAIWVNPKEKLNGKDDDKNGWIDDINGWNFLGNDTTTLNYISHEGDREYLRLKDKYDQYLMVSNGKAYKYDDAANALVETPLPADMEEYNYFSKVVKESELAESYRAITLGKAVVWYIHELDKKLKQEFPDKQLTKQDFMTFFNQRKNEATEFEKGWYDLVALMFMSSGSDDWDKMVAFASTKYVPYQEELYQRTLKRRFPKDRAIIGDNAYDINDRNYGNNNLRADNSKYGTLIAGIIGAKRGNPEIEGVAENVKIMTLRVDADEYGEPYLKDIALAIRYAVDKGANIIQMGKTNTLYPRSYSQWVDDALKYAEQKGVLVVLPVMDYYFNMDEQPFYPNRKLHDGELTNIITVAASDSLGNPYKQANFGKTELDLFAPGVNIQSSFLDNKYAVVSGSPFAAAMVTGVAAFIKSYYPEITPAQMRKLLMDNVTKHGDAEVEKQFRSKGGRLAADLFLFSELSITGGILNAEKAFIEAKKLK